MPYEAMIAHVRDKLTSIYAWLDAWFDQPQAMRAYRPVDGGWTIDEILEHVTLTSHYLLIVIRNSCTTCLKRRATRPIVGDESNLDQMAHIAHPDAFPWLRPEHMEPTRALASAEVRSRLHAQFVECLDMLGKLPHGEGVLHTVRMSVQELGKLDVYQWLYFLALHGERHNVELERILHEYQQR